MLPGPIVPPPPPPPLVLIGSAFVPSPSPSDPRSSSISSSLAIIIVIIITTVTITTCIVILRRGCHRRRLSCSSLSPRRSFSPMAVSSSSAESGMRSAASAAVASAASSVTHSAEGPVKGAELVSSSPVSAVMTMCGVDTLVPSAPSLPAEERLILELLALPAVRMKPGQRMVCIICKHEFLPTDVLLVLPVCSHVFHQSCIVKCLRCTTPSCCPSCYASITIPVPDKTKVAPTFCSDEYDIESQMRMPSPPGAEVAEAVGGSHGWLRSSLDRLSGSWRGCSNNCATAAVVPVSSRRTTGSPSQGSSGRLGNGLDCAKAQQPLPVPASEEGPEAVRASLGWLRSLATLPGSWNGRSSSFSAEMGLPVTSRHVTETLASSGHSITDSWSRRWDLEAATVTPERPSFYEYARSFFRSSGK
ncbi:hypothetical protein SETIT_3G278900v2 [Setaria italica]|uniref:RING-type domain-containing protein n=2 Tax=Setaria italica TaxID=4555 RepID=K3ZDI2_SETIT|nr:hypothetical protein SETIT_3G278900v2 [Setaria italica]